MIESIRTASRVEFNNVVSLHRLLHKNPELSFKEVNTSKIIAQELDNIGIPYFDGIGGTGIIAIIEGQKEGKTLAIRAELDALPINEDSGVEYSSQNKSVMHACGHDVHMASLVGTAKILWHHRKSIKGKVLLIFQPGEELLPGGAKLIIESEPFKKYFPDYMLGWHILPELPTGVCGFRNGPYMASGDEIYITVKGKGGHAALPHTVIDPVLIASHIIVGLQQIVSRKGPSNIPTVLSFGKINGSGANNIIPDFVEIEGTFRTMDEEWRAKAHEQIESISSGIAKGMGGDCDVEIRKGYPALSNNPNLSDFASKAAAEYLGISNVVDLPIRMTTDDFAYYSEIVPATYFRLGVGFDNIKPYSLHNPKLVVNEHVFEHSVGLTAWLIMSILNSFEDLKR
jgi:amidohydrolase